MAVPDLADLAREGLVLALVLSLPIIGAACLAGVLTALLQAYTKLSDAALSFVPRALAVGIAILVAAPWIGSRLTSFAERVWALIQSLG